MREICNYCHLPIGTVVEVQDRQMKLRRAVDHFIPIALGGSDDDINKVLACHLCNAWKHAKLFKTVEECSAAVQKFRTEQGFVVVSQPDPGRVDANLQEERTEVEDSPLPGVRVRKVSKDDRKVLQRQVQVSRSNEAYEEKDQRRPSLCPHPRVLSDGKCCTCEERRIFPWEVNQPRSSAITVGSGLVPPEQRGSAQTPVE